jgi:hypothetical protein
MLPGIFYAGARQASPAALKSLNMQTYSTDNRWFDMDFGFVGAPKKGSFTSHPIVN